MAGKKLKILVVEDDMHVRFILQKFLEPFGQVYTAVDGEEGLMAFRLASSQDDLFDLICIDIMMPKLDGVAMLKEIRELEKQQGILLGRGVKALVISALTDPKSVMESFHEICHGYLFKPIRKENLFAKLKELGFELN